VSSREILNEYKPLARPIAEIDYRKYRAPAWRIRRALDQYLERHKELKMAIVYKNRRLFLINKRCIHVSDIAGEINRLLGE